MMAFDTLLVANRGEIACRVIRTAKALGLKTLAVCSEADAGAPHTLLADETVQIGAGPVGESYLRGDRIIAAAQQTGAGAIHPGYGFLSENADFAEAVAAAGLVFVGPPAQAIRAMGSKAEAKRLMIAAGVPCVPGYEGEDQSPDTLTRAAADIGYPVMVKASAGGGGRGMRLVPQPGDMADALALARSEAENAFGSGHLILEKAILRPRHVEFQVFADAHGTVVHMGERDCSVQRRHQKVVEEAPCPVMTPDLRARMGQAAVEAARAVDYRGAGTVEFLLDSAGEFYFLEMNTRLQVEHPVTELVTGLDLVALQIAVAQGDPLPLAQEDVQLQGHAIEVRLYAEEPANEFLPATGNIALWHPAEGTGIRIDGGVRTGQDVSPFYDPMLAKIIASGPTRSAALSRLRKAVRDTVLLGVPTNSAFLDDLLGQPALVAGQATTALLEEAYPDGVTAPEASGADLALAAALGAERDRNAACAQAVFVAPELLHWSSAPLLPRLQRLALGEAVHELRVVATPDGWIVTVDGAEIAVHILQTGDHTVRARVDGATVDAVWSLAGATLHLAVGANRFAFARLRAGRQGEDEADGSRVVAPMPGLVLELMAEPGAAVTKGQTLAVLEAMKMQHQITAAVDGRIEAVHVKAGQQLASGDVMVEIEETSA
ncbi:MAG: biotin/lipoyl-binding protein [Marinibacterium sp.]|nr:biotin/lipoyl-binding protein [Marinibacterium sp.]